jgi:hypothetical protein
MQLVTAFSPPHRQKKTRHADQDHETTQAPLRTSPDRPGPGNPGRFQFPRLRASLKVLGDLFIKVVKMMIADRLLHDHRHLTDSKKIGGPRQVTRTAS